jgi:RNA polymerase sigma-B factor
MPTSKSKTKNQTKFHATQPVPSRAGEQRPKTPNKASVASRNGRVEEFQTLVKPIAAFYASCTPEPFDDLLQVGLMGLMRAAELYCSSNSAPFEAFAKPHVRGAILHYLRDAAPLIRLPRRVAELQQKAKRGLNREGLGLELTESQRRGLEELKAWRPPISLDQLPLDGFDIAAPLEANPGIGAEDTAAAVEALQRLDAQSRWIVGKVVLEGWSYRRAASQLQVSPMTVQRRLKQGLALVKSALEQRSGQGPSWHPSQFAAGGC